MILPLYSPYNLPHGSTWGVWSNPDYALSRPGRSPKVGAFSELPWRSNSCGTDCLRNKDSQPQQPNLLVLTNLWWIPGFHDIPQGSLWLQYLSIYKVVAPSDVCWLVYESIYITNYCTHIHRHHIDTINHSSPSKPT